MKTRIITSVFGLALLAVVLCLFNTPVFEVAVALACLIAAMQYILNKPKKDKKTEEVAK